ncbi:MAG: tetrapyrrole methylase [Deltaproteobacteria bacterium]|nr:tetrapyrrole methylase [Deltaproteobacteria bacterium]
MITVRAIETIRQSDIIICRPETRQEFSQYMQGKTFWNGAFREWRTYRKDCASIEDKDLRAACQHNQEVRDALAAKIRQAVKEGKTVSVLGSGDLLIYGGPYRWYMEELKDLDIKIIPGVSCLNAANAALGRDIMTGGETHSTVMTTYREIDKMAAAHPTMVIFTMHTKFPDLVEKLKAHYPMETPIAIVFHAGYKQKEQIISGTLADILEKTGKMKFPFEHLVYVGNFLQ